MVARESLAEIEAGLQHPFSSAIATAPEGVDALKASPDSDLELSPRGSPRPPEEGGFRTGGKEHTCEDGVELATKTPEDSEEKEQPDEVEIGTHHANGLQDQTNYLPAKQVILIFLGLTMAVFLSFLDQTIVSTALPSISASFNAGRSSSWVASAYLLTSTCVQPLWGRTSDIFGRKACILACVVVFAVGSLACALASSMTMLIVFRGLQGCGGGGLLTLVLITISDIVSLKDRGKYQGINEATIAIANGCGPVIGGVLAEKVGWRWCFWINLPFSAITLLVIIFLLPLKPVKGEIGKKLRQIDYIGALLTLFGAALIILPLNWGGTSFSWSSGPVLGCLLGGVAVLVLCGVYEAKVATIPIIPAQIFHNSTSNAVFLGTFISGATILTQSFYLPQYFQIVRGDSAIRSGVLVLPLLILITFSVFCGGQLVARTGEYKINICIGYAVWAVGLGLLSTLSESTSDARVIGYMVLTGLGQGQTLQTTMVAVQASVSREMMSTATSTRNFLRTLGGALAVPVSAAIINNTLRSRLSSESGFSSTLIDAVIDDSTAIWRPTLRGDSTLYNLPAEEKAKIISGFVGGFHRVFYVWGALIACDFFLAVFFIKRINLSRDDEKALKARGKAWVAERKGKPAAADADLEQGDKDDETVVDAGRNLTKP